MRRVQLPRSEDLFSISFEPITNSDGTQMNGDLTRGVYIYYLRPWTWILKFHQVVLTLASSPATSPTHTHMPVAIVYKFELRTLITSTSLQATTGVSTHKTRDFRQYIFFAFRSFCFTGVTIWVWQNNKRRRISICSNLHPIRRDSYMPCKVMALPCRYIFTAHRPGAPVYSSFCATYRNITRCWISHTIIV